MARALPPDGKLITLEADPSHADVARQNIHLAGLNDRIEQVEGPALSSLENFGDVPPFDLIFIDADKPNNPGYLEWALHYSRPGTVIIGDNVVREGEVVNGQPSPTGRGRKSGKAFSQRSAPSPAGYAYPKSDTAYRAAGQRS